jgi:hypothetical protein
MAAKVDLRDATRQPRARIAVRALAPLVPVEPFVDHGMSQRFRLRTIAIYDLSGHFNVARMNGYDPLIPFDPSADSISNALVFHGPQRLSGWLTCILAFADRGENRETFWRRQMSLLRQPLLFGRHRLSARPDYAGRRPLDIEVPACHQARVISGQTSFADFRSHGVDRASRRDADLPLKGGTTIAVTPHASELLVGIGTRN